MRPKKLMFTGLFVLVGLGVLVFGGLKVAESSATKSWPTAEGRVLESLLVRQLGSRRTYPYEVRVRYAYEVEGQSFEGDRYNVHGAYKANSEADANAKAAALTAEAAITVYYDPNEPEISVLAQGGTVSSWLIVLVGLLLSGGGLYSALRPRRR